MIAALLIRLMCVLHLWNTPEEAIDAVHDLPGLVCLTARVWTYGDLSCVVGMPVLDSLNIYGDLESFEGLETLTNLNIVYIDCGSASDLTSFSGLPALRQLEIYNTPLGDLSPLATLESLEEIRLDPALREEALGIAAFSEEIRPTQMHEEPSNKGIFLTTTEASPIINSFFHYYVRVLVSRRTSPLRTNIPRKRLRMR